MAYASNGVSMQRNEMWRNENISMDINNENHQRNGMKNIDNERKWRGSMVINNGGGVSGGKMAAEKRESQTNEKR
jgi:hypothetical protein